MSNDLSVLSVNANESISTILTISKGGTRVLTPFETFGGSSQTVTITLPDATMMEIMRLY